jgi:hypothetical protein
MPFAQGSFHPVRGHCSENILADGRDHFFVASISFWPPQARLAERFAAQSTQPLAFGLAKPDLLEIQWTEGRIVWRVIDPKAFPRPSTEDQPIINHFVVSLPLTSKLSSIPFA